MRLAGEAGELPACPLLDSELAGLQEGGYWPAFVEGRFTSSGRPG
jgi:hypothetical protein